MIYFSHLFNTNLEISNNVFIFCFYDQIFISHIYGVAWYLLLFY